MPRRYETVYIFDSALDEPAITEKLERFHALLTTDGKGSITNVAHWGKRTLAFPIKKREAGHYVVAQFETAAELLPEYERAVKLDEGVLRYLVVVSEGLPAKPEVAPVAAAVIAPEEEELEEDEA
jgi:small subunit ribosomal protein S6